MTKLREDLFQVRTHGVHRQTQLPCRVFDRLFLEQGPRRAGGVSQPVEATQHRVRDDALGQCVGKMWISTAAVGSVALLRTGMTRTPRGT